MWTMWCYKIDLQTIHAVVSNSMHPRVHIHMGIGGAPRKVATDLPCVTFSLYGQQARALLVCLLGYLYGRYTHMYHIPIPDLPAR